jgi:2'-5' RNA ligase
VFFALWPLGAAADSIAAHAARAGLGGKPVAAARLHLTLAFHGRCAPAAIDNLTQRADAVEGRAFSLVLDRLGGFRRAGVVWVAPSRSPSALTALAAALARAGQGIDQRNFRPHITVSRRGRYPVSSTFPAVTLTAASFALVASGENGAPGAYRALARWSLR